MTTNHDPPLTADILIDIRNRLILTEQLVYAVHEAITPGKALLVSESDMYYAYVVFHSQEEAESVAAVLGKKLLHTRDAPRRPLSIAVSGWMK